MFILKVRPARGMLVTLALVAGLTVLPAASANAAANKASAKVTICHRTHATTNPYRQITVSINSVIKNNGHDDSEHNKDGDAKFPKYGDNTPVYVFDPGYTYTPNAKMWGDIIPAFFYVDGGTTKYFAGRNWSSNGKAIYYGLGDKAGLCGPTGAKEFALAEYEAWLEDNPNPSNGDITSQKRKIINDLKDQENFDDGDLKDFDTDFENLPASPKKPKGPNRPEKFSDLITEIEEKNEGKNPANGDVLYQALAGKVWKDMNNNGIEDPDEEIFDNLGIQVVDEDGNVLTPEELAELVDPQTEPASTQSQGVTRTAIWFGEKASFTTAATETVTITTDENGYFEIPLLPAGDWKVIVITPDGWSYTYDSSGTSDGTMPETYVPAGGAGFAWAGLVFVGSEGPTDPEDPNDPNDPTDGTEDTSVVLPDTGAETFFTYAFLFAIVLLGFGGVTLLRLRSQ